jgi:uncharacterized protein YdbL (DUF1318 family)
MAAVLLLIGCVVIPKEMDIRVTLDIRHIQEQAGQVLDYIEGSRDSLPGLEPAPATSWLRRAIDRLDPMPVAHAQDLKRNSPLVTEIATSLRNRFAQVEALKQAGCAGESNRGYLELRPCDATADAAKKNEAQKLVSEENKDRKALYKEIAQLNSDQADVTVSTIERVYAMERLNRAKSGEIFQLPPAGADFDGVKGSALGKALGAACQPEAWVTIP